MNPTATISLEMTECVNNYFLRMNGMISILCKIIHLCHSCITTPQNLQA